MAVSNFLSKVKRIEEQHHSRRKHEERPHSGNHDESNWLVSYADMMTLLCGFFIMLFSMAKIDDRQYEKVKEAMTKQFGGDYKSQSAETAKFVSQLVQELGSNKDVVVRADPFGVSITFESTVFFDTLGSDVKPEGRVILDRLIGAIAGRQEHELKQYKIVVEGHTDSRPVLSGGFPSNWELSSARAARVVRLFLERGFHADHLTAIGYADTYPATEARGPDGSYNDEALAKNRRVVLRVLDPKLESIPYPTVGSYQK